jgi:hypothetical protein
MTHSDVVLWSGRALDRLNEARHALEMIEDVEGVVRENVDFVLAELDKVIFDIPDIYDNCIHHSHRRDDCAYE